MTNTALNSSTVLKSRNNDAQAVIDFWYQNSDKWFVKSDDFDNTIAQTFGDVLKKAKAGELFDWRCDVMGRLAEIIVLDQFSRNVYRHRKDAFAQDGMALVLAQEALNCPDFATLAPDYQKFVIMPFMHSESSVIHKVAVDMFKKLGDDNTLDFEYKHKAIIDRFGRYPHRNAILNRDSNDDELAFLQQPNSSF